MAHNSIPRYMLRHIGRCNHEPQTGASKQVAAGQLVARARHGIGMAVMGKASHGVRDRSNNIRRKYGPAGKMQQH